MQTREGLAAYTKRELQVLTSQSEWKATDRYPLPPSLSPTSRRLQVQLLAEAQFWHITDWFTHAPNADNPGYDELRLKAAHPPLKPYNRPQLWGQDLPWGGQPGLDLMAIWQANVRRSLQKPEGGTIPALRYLNLKPLFSTFTQLERVIIRPDVLVSGSSRNPTIVEDPLHRAVVELHKKS